MNLPPLAIVGPTAVGKSALALQLALRVGGEIVSVDSMQVYRGMDIGTAKPTTVEQELVAHHLIDLLEPSETCSVAWFQQEARRVLAEVGRRRVPAILVGGTGLYHRAVVDGLEIPGRWPAVRERLEEDPDTAALYGRLRRLDPVAAGRIDPGNRRRIIRALEVCEGSGRRFSDFGPGLEQYEPSAVVTVGLHIHRDQLTARLATRLAAQMEAGFLDEVARLEAKLSGIGWSTTSSEALGYRELRAHLRGELGLEAATEEILVRTRRFAVRQLRWFRRDPRILWFDHDREDLLDAVESAWRNHAGTSPGGSLG